MVRPFLIRLAVLAVVACSGHDSASAAPVRSPAAASNLVPTAFLVEDASVTGRRFDWGRYQSSSSYALGGGLFVTTWSYPPFGPFVAEHGDGGEVYAVDGDTVRIVATQDGGKPFLQELCGPTGWVLFKADAPTGRWAEMVARLWSQPTGSGPCAAEVSAFTRYRLETVAVPFIVAGERTERILPTIISEHYNEGSLEAATAMERTFLARGVGRAIWEAWTTGEPAGHRLAERCPGTVWSIPPAPGWRLSDCRTATDLASGDRFNRPRPRWPPASLRLR